jgi:Zn-dependent protease with chaperone function
MMKGGTAAQVYAREHRHRRLVLLGIAFLILTSTTPVFGHHLLPEVGALVSPEHLGTLCVRAVRAMLAPVHDGFHWIILAGLAVAAVDRFRALRLLHRVVSGLASRAPERGSPLWIAARRAGIASRRVRVLDHSPNPAFTTGLLHPRIYVAKSLASALDADQLAALLAHEAEHVRRRDPLRLSIMRALACTLFWIPALRRLASDLADEAEIQADDAAVARAGAIPLAGALVTLAAWPAHRSSIAPGFAQDSLLDRRVRRLLGEPVTVGTHVTWRSLTLALAALGLVWASGLAALEPAGRGVVAEHCQHDGAFPFRHLFCLRAHQPTPGDHCAHVLG